jgi:hypothetical protein
LFFARAMEFLVIQTLNGLSYGLLLLLLSAGLTLIPIEEGRDAPFRIPRAS